MAHRRIKRGISVVLILFMLVIYVNAPFGNGIRAFGDTVTDLNQAKDKQDQLSSQYEDTKKQLEQLQQGICGYEKLYRTAGRKNVNAG